MKSALRLTALLLCGATLARADDRLLLTHQGRLLGHDEAPVEGSISMRFSIYETSGADPRTPDVELWSATYQVEVSDGVYAVVLGSSAEDPPLAPVMGQQAPRWLGIAIDDEEELRPRLRFGAAGYAHQAGAAQRLGSLAPEDLALAGHTHATHDLVVQTTDVWPGATAWARVEGRPDAFPPEPHTHGAVDLTLEATDEWPGRTSWNRIDAKPQTFAPAAHGHPFAEIVVDPEQAWPGSTQWDRIEGKPQTFPPSSHPHPFADVQVGTADEWPGRASWTRIDSKPEAFPPEAHRHDASEVDGLAETARTAVTNVALSGLRVGNDTRACTGDLAGTLRYGVSGLEVCDGTGWIAALAPDGSTRERAARTCLEIKRAFPLKGNGRYWVDPNGPPTTDALEGYCDMTSDGGGWTIVYAATGADGEVPLTSDTMRSGSPLASGHYNTTRAFKAALSQLSSETLLRRPNLVWLKASEPAFNLGLTGTIKHAHVRVTLTTSNYTTAEAWMGYSNYNISGGGDFAITSNGFDHHSTYFNHLNSGCAGHYLYSYSNDSADSDAGYDVQVTFADWTITQACEGGEGGKLQFFMAMR